MSGDTQPGARGEGPALRAYAALLHLYPRRFREEFRADMVELLRQQLGAEPTLRVMARCAIDLLITVPTQHLETHMRAPSRSLAVVFLAVAAAGAGLAVVGGTAPAMLTIGLLVAVGCGVVGVVAWRQAAPFHESTVTAGWWKYLLAGPLLVAAVIVAAGFGVEAWELMIVTVFTAAVLTIVGAALGLAHLLRSHARGAPA